MAKAPAICQWISLQQALAAFAENVSGHQGRAISSLCIGTLLAAWSSKAASFPTTLLPVHLLL